MNMKSKNLETILIEKRVHHHNKLIYTKIDFDRAFKIKVSVEILLAGFTRGWIHNFYHTVAPCSINHN